MWSHKPFFFFFRMWLFTINVQQTVNGQKQKQTDKNTKSWPNLWERQDENDTTASAGVPWAVTPPSARDSTIRINAGLSAEPEKQKCWNQKKNEERRKSEQVADEWLEETRHALSSSGLRCDVASKESDPGSGQGRGLTPMRPQPEHEKGRNEWPSWHVFQVGIEYRDSKNWTMLRTLRVPFWNDPWISWCLGSTSSHQTTLLRIYHQIIASEINEPVQGCWLRPTGERLLHCPRCFPVICWALKKPGCGI